MTFSKYSPYTQPAYTMSEVLGDYYMHKQQKVFSFTEDWYNPYYSRNLYTPHSSPNSYEKFKVYDVYLDENETEGNLHRSGLQVSLLVRFLSSMGVKRPKFHHIERQDVVSIEDLDNPNGVHYHGGEGWLLMLVNNKIIDTRDFFMDWSKPSQNELDYFQMIYNIKLNWSEDEPFPLIRKPEIVDIKANCKWF